MTAGGEERGQGGTDETGGTRHRHGQWSRTQRRQGSLCGQVGGELPVPVAERLHEGRPGHGCLHDVGDPCGRTCHRIKEVRVAPPQRQRHELVHELARRLVPAVLCHPAQPTGQAQHGLPVSQRRSLLEDPDRLPGRHQAWERARSLVPGEHLVHGCFDDAGITESHMSLHTRHAAEGIGMLELAGVEPHGKGCAPVLRRGAGSCPHCLLPHQPRAGRHPDHAQPAREAQRHECGADRRGCTKRSRASRPRPHAVWCSSPGAGRGFCAGLDLGGLRERPRAPTASVGSRPASPPRRTSWRWFPGCGRCRNWSSPPSNGSVAGGGLALALASDIRIAPRPRPASTSPSSGSASPAVTSA